MEILTRLFYPEFIEAGPIVRKLESSMSRGDKKFMKILQEGAKLRNGHYQVPLSFKDPYVDLPNNKYETRQRRKISAKMTNSDKATSGL